MILFFFVNTWFALRLWNGIPIWYFFCFINENFLSKSFFFTFWRIFSRKSHHSFRHLSMIDSILLTYFFFSNRKIQFYTELIVLHMCSASIIFSIVLWNITIFLWSLYCIFLLLYDKYKKIKWRGKKKQKTYKNLIGFYFNCDMFH